MPCDLLDKKCVPCEGGVEPLSLIEAKKLLQQIPQWQIDATGKIISRHFKLKGFYQVMGFVNAIAWMAQQENHHPEIKLSYNMCEVSYTTHAINGLSENDFICARKVDALLQE